MAELTEQVGLDVAQAIRDGEELALSIGGSIESAISTAFESFSTLGATAADAVATAMENALADVPVSVDASAAPAEIESAIAGVDAVVPVDADTAPAEASVSDLADKIDSTDTTITVGADTSSAQDNVDQLTESTDSASESLGEGTTAATAFGGATTLASGGVGALSNVAGDLASKSGALGPAIGGGIAALGIFVGQAINSTGATQRLNDQLGEFALRIETIHVGSLNQDLGDLALRTGSSATEMRNAAVDAFRLQTSFGATGDSAATFAADILALSSRAVALNPSLGTAGQAAGALISALASGRDKALIPFDLGLTGVEIKARATALALLDGRDASTAADRAFVGAALASERLGGSLERDIAKGSENPIIQLRTLAREFGSFTTEIGKPLIVPVLDTLKALEPVIKDVLTPLGQLATEVLPILVDVLGFLAPVIGPVVGGFIAFKVATAGFGLILDVVNLAAIGVSATIGVAFPAAAASFDAAVEGAGLAVDAALGPIGIVIGVASAAAIAFGLFGGSAEEANPQVKAFGDAVEKAGGQIDVAGQKALASALGDTLHQLAQSGVDLPIVLDGVTHANKRTTDALREYIDVASHARGQSDITPQFEKLIGVLVKTDPALSQVFNVLDDGNGVSAENARLILNLALQYQTATGKAADLKAFGLDPLAASTDIYTGAIDKATQAGIDFVAALQAQEDIQNRLINDQLGLTGAAINYEKAVTDQKTAQENYNNVLNAYGQAAADASPAALELESANLRLAQSAIAMDAAQTALNIDLNDRAAVDGALQKLRDLQAAYPAAAGALEPYVVKLQEQRDLLDFLKNLGPVTPSVTVTTNGVEDLDHVAGALTFLREHPATNLDVFINAIQTGGGTTGAVPLPSNFQDYLDEQRRIAEGAAYVASLQGRAGGGPVEAGKSYIVNEDTPRSEIFTPWASGYVQPQIRMPAYASVGAPVVQHVDNSTHMTTNVPPNYQTPERVTLFTLKRLRAESHLAGK